MDRDNVLFRLEKTFSEIAALQEICRVPSISVGVLHEGEVLFAKSVGWRVCDGQDDNPGNLEATPDSAYLTASSCSKMLLACAVGILVDEGKMSWDDLISKHVPEFDLTNDCSIREEATLRHALSHTTRIGRQMPLLISIRGTILVNEENFVGLLNQAPTHPKIEDANTNADGQTSGRAFHYSNFPMAMVALAVEHASGQRYAEFIQQRILQPLELSNTIVTQEALVTNPNKAITYAKQKDGNFVEVDTDELTDERHTPLLSFLGVRSSVTDVLKMTSALLEAHTIESKVRAGEELKCQTPFRQVSEIWNPQADLSEDLSYGMGCYLGSFASETFSSTGINCKTRSQDQKFFQTHIIGRNTRKQNIPKRYVAHLGYYAGSSSSITIFPETRTSIVAFANGMDLGDAADWSVKMLAQALYDTTPQVDILALAKKEAEFHKQWFDNMLIDWLEDRNIMHQEKDLNDYVGLYQGCNTAIRISLCNKTAHLTMTINDKSKASFSLEMYENDTYSFMALTRDDYLRKGMIDWDYYFVGVLYFGRNREGAVDNFEWRYEAEENSGIFTKIE